jgi:hypothetical protein
MSFRLDAFSACGIEEVHLRSDLAVTAFPKAGEPCGLTGWVS